MKVVVQFNEVSHKWMLGLQTDRGAYQHLGDMNGQEEARTIQAVLQGAVELLEVTSDIGTHGGEVMRIANDVVGGRRLLELVKELEPPYDDGFFR